MTNDDTPPDILTLRDLSGRVPLLTVACGQCERRARLSVAQLIAKHGADMPLSAILADLSVDCPRRDDTARSDRCDPYFRHFRPGR